MSTFPRLTDRIVALRLSDEPTREELLNTVKGQESLIIEMQQQLLTYSLETLVAEGLKAATFKATPDGRIVEYNDHAEHMCGPISEQGGNLYSLIVDRLHRISSVSSDVTGVIEAVAGFSEELKKKYETALSVPRLNARPIGGGLREVFSEKRQMIFESQTCGSLRVLVAVAYVHDPNGHPWMQLSLVDLEAFNKCDLTGLWRRGTFDNALARKTDERKRSAERYGHYTPLALFMIDFDRFGSVNDTHGHLAGDDVLRVVSRRISRVFPRKNDVVARYGGEEVAVLCDADRGEAEDLARRLLSVVRSSDIKVTVGNAKRVLRMTVSIGVTLFKGEDDTAAGMVGRADESLYLAKGDKGNSIWPWKKQKGRNRAFFDGDLLPDPDA